MLVNRNAIALVVRLEGNPVRLFAHLEKFL